jgi:hypothetical protein
MNKTLKLVLSVAVVIATGLGGYFYGKSQVVLGSSNPTVLTYQEFEGGVKFGNVLSTTTPASMTLGVADLYGYDTVIVRPTGAASAKTLTFFASSTASHWLPIAGDTQRTCILNATTTSGVTLVFAAGTGIDIQTASSSPTDLTILPDQTACFTFIRKAQVAGVTNSFDIEANMTEFTDGD